MNKFFHTRGTVALITVALIKAATFLGFITYFGTEVIIILLAIANFIH